MSVPLISLLVTEPLYDGTTDVITEIPMDACISRNYDFRAQVTQFPIETGSTVTDHVHLQPDELTLEGMVSNVPVTEVPTVLDLRGDAQASPGATAGGRAQQAYDALLTVFRKRLPLTVFTEHNIYEDMILESLSIPKDRVTGDSLKFSASLKKIYTVKTLTASLPTDVVARLKRRRKKTKKAGDLTRETYRDRVAREAEAGKKSSKEATAKAQSTALATTAALGK
jgi:hypothetical protein